MSTFAFVPQKRSPNDAAAPTGDPPPNRRASPTKKTPKVSILNTTSALFPQKRGSSAAAPTGNSPTHPNRHPT